jgi:DNA invertase Pin-like site-specific DNA recombinase
MSKGEKIGYVRVSTIDQNPERQLEGIDLDKKFVDYCSGATVNRPQLKSLLEYVREDDIVIVHALDRLGRRLIDILHLVEYFLKKNVHIHFIKENLKFTGIEDPMSKCILTLFGCISEYEYSLIRERQLEGVALAKKAGKYKGREKSLNDNQIEEMMKTLENTRKSKSAIARDFGISRFTLYNYIREFNQKTEEK